MPNSGPFDELSEPERRVVAQVRAGRSNAEIAIRLGLSVDSVEALLGAALIALGLDDRAALRVVSGELSAPKRGLPRRRLGALLFAAGLARAVALPFLLSSGSDARPVGSETAASTETEEAATTVAELVSGLTNRSTMETPRALHSATPLADGSVLLVGGIDLLSGRQLGSAEIYDPPTGEFALLSLRIPPRSRHTTTVLRDGRVLIAGGRGVDPIDSAAIIDLVSGALLELAPLSVARGSHSATLLRDGRVLLLGGQDADGARASAELFDPITNSFREIAALEEARWGHSATRPRDGRVLIAGGRDADGEVIDRAELFDPRGDSFRLLDALSSPRFAHTATLLVDDRVMLVGGSDHVSATASIEAFDPVDESFTRVGTLAAARSGHSATSLADGTILFVGGIVPANDELPLRVDRYDPQSGELLLMPSLESPRSGHSVTRLLDGSLLVLGGLLPAGVDEPYTLERINPAQVLQRLRLPDPPTLVELVVSSGAVRAHWEATAELGDDEIVANELLSFGQTRALVRVAADVREAALAELQIGQDYRFVVRAVTEGGAHVASAPSAPVAIVTPPGGVRAVVITPFRNAVQLSWLPPLNDGGRIDRYDIVLNEGERVITIAATRGLSRQVFATIDGFENGREYRVAITAWNPAGPGRVADTAVVEPATDVGPGPGEPLSFTPSDAYLRLEAVGSQTLLLEDGRLLVAGRGVLDLFDPVAERFSDGGSVPDGGRSHSALLLADGRVLLLGGCCGELGTPLPNVDIYDPALGTFEPASPLPRLSLGFSSTLLPDGRVLITGGRTRGAGAGLIADTYYFDLAGGGWTRGPDLSVPRDGHTATLLPDGRVLIAGGIDRLATGATVADVEILDPVSASTVVVGALEEARRFHQAILLANRTAVIIGGSTRDFAEAVELFDPASRTLTAITGLGLPSAASAIGLGASRLLVVGLTAGGRAAAGVLDLRAQTYEQIEPAQLSQSRPLLTRLADGRILLLAGGSFGGMQSFAEIYDPLSGEFRLVR